MNSKWPRRHQAENIIEEPPLSKDSSRWTIINENNSIFCISEINRRNDRWLAHNPEDVPIIARTKCPANVHVLGVVSSKGDVMPPHFFFK